MKSNDAEASILLKNWEIYNYLDDWRYFLIQVDMKLAESTETIIGDFYDWIFPGG